jgi:TolB-like protein
MINNHETNVTSILEIKKMASLIPGYEYDIFISYRHKDNRYDRWVTEFVTNLQKELDSTFKEEVSLYFDENLDDGLHESSDVDGSIKNKIKCLVFIPILSRTYCDPASFAWKHELLAFLDFANKDSFGLKIKDTHGNVSNRILPIKIHELESVDTRLFEHEICGAIRSIDFVFKSLGVNRPLRAHEDEPHENQHHIFYRDQINKVANTVKAIITSMKQQLDKTEAGAVAPRILLNGKQKIKSHRFIIAALSMFLLCSASFDLSTLFRGLSPSTEGSTKSYSIAVLPFNDMSKAKDQGYFCDGLGEEIENLLTKIPELKVITRTLACAIEGKNADIRNSSETLGVAYILKGSVRKSGDKIRITVQLIRTRDGSHLWSETFNRTIEDVFVLEDDVAERVARELNIKLLDRNYTTLLLKH